MTTVTSTQLLANMAEIIKRVRGGEQIAVTYRYKIAFQIEPTGEDDKNLLS